MQKRRKPQFKELDPKGGQWYRDLKALNPNPTPTPAELKRADKFFGWRKYRNRLPYIVTQTGRVSKELYDRNLM